MDRLLLAFCKPFRICFLLTHLLRHLVDANSIVHNLIQDVSLPCKTTLDFGIPSMCAISSPIEPSTFHFTPLQGKLIMVIVTSMDSNANGYINLDLQNSLHQSWKSSNSSSPFLSFIPTTTDVGSLFTIKVTSLSSKKVYFDIVVTYGDDKSPTQLFEGIQQYGKVSALHESFYTFTTNAINHVTNRVKQIEISVISLNGDADIFVNPSSKGFYHRSWSFTNHSDAYPTWTSQRSTGRDIILVPKNTSTLDTYYITVYGFQAASYYITAMFDNTVLRLSQGVATESAVAAKGYRYFKFLNTDLTKDVLFDVQPTSGDADLYISCTLLATGTDAGFPSRQPGHSNFSSSNYLEDALSIAPSDPHTCPMGTFYLAVYGYSASEFKVVATLGSTGGSPLVLFPGVPMTGLLYRRLSTAYRFWLGPQQRQVDIVLTPMDGDCDLFVRVGGKGGVPRMDDFDYRSNKFGSAVDEVHVPESAVCIDCWVSVLVYAYATSSYSIYFSFNDTTVQLTNALPLKGSVAAGSGSGPGLCQYYAIRSGTGAGTRVRVNAILTVFSGYPRLFISSVYRNPCDVAHANASSDSLNTGMYPYVEMIENSHVNVFYIGVGGSAYNSTYTVRAAVEVQPLSVPTLYRLLTGIPQSDVIPYDYAVSWKYYQVIAEAGHESIYIHGISVIGNVDMYVNRCPFPSLAACLGYSGTDTRSYLPNATHYLASTMDESGSGSGQDNMRILRNDPDRCMYIIGVNSRSIYASYDLSVKFETTVMALQAGVPVFDHADPGETDFFSFFLRDSHEKLTLSLAPLSGDPDLYVSTTLQYPGPRNYTWKATNYGADTLTIDPGQDSRACDHCMYFIAVYGASSSPSSYTLLARLDSTIPHLLDGVPTAGTVPAASWVQYVFSDTFGDTRDFRIVLSGDGNADLYVTLDGSEPSWFAFDYRSNNIGSDDIVSISHRDPSYAPCRGTGTSCSIRMAVYGSITSAYTITITSSSSAQLISHGNPVSSTVTMDELYYLKTFFGGSGSYNTSTSISAPGSLRLSLTVYSGEVALYMSCGGAGDHLTPSTYTWSYGGGSGGVFLLPSIVAQDAGCSAWSMLYICVYGVTDASFSLLVQVQDPGTATVSHLSSGVTLSVPDLQTGAFNYYYVTPGASYQDITISVNILLGNIAVYISKDWEHRAVPSLSPGSYLYSLFPSSSSGSILINHDKILDMCIDRTSCYFLVAVFGSAASITTTTSYTVSANYRDSTVVLANGVPYRSIVARGRYEYFTYILDSTNYDIFISVVPINGDADVFVSLSPVTHPTRTNASWVSVLYGEDNIAIQSTELASACARNTNTAKPCALYIGVFGWLNCSYAVTVSADRGFRSPFTLLDGQPQAGTVGMGRYKYYKYTINQQGLGALLSSIRITVQTLDGGDVDMYAVLGARDGEPGKGNWKYRSINFGSLVDEIEIHPGMEGYCTNCTMYLAVFGFKGGGYTIAASSSGLRALQPGSALADRVPQTKYRYYTFANTDPAAEIVISLSTLSGDADLYANVYTPGPGTGAVTGTGAIPFPGVTSSQWRSNKLGDDVIKIKYSDALFCASSDCLYIIAVYGYSNATYTLLATHSESTVINLYMNRPQLVYGTGTASTGTGTGVKYFSATPVNSADAVSISSTSLNTGYVDMYVQIYNASMHAIVYDDDIHYNTSISNDINSINKHMRLPDPNDPGSYIYTTHNTQDDIIIIPGPFPSPIIIIIAVLPVTCLSYSLLASTRTGQHPVLLQAGIPQNHFVGLGQTMYFDYYSMEQQNLQISVTARSGDPDLLVSFMHERPVCTASPSSYYDVTCSNYTWMSRKYSTDVIIISQDLPCEPINPSTVVSPDCDLDPGTGLDPYRSLHIGVYGYREAKFSITAVPSGMHVRLVSGVPQLASTASAYDCTARTRTGVCVQALVQGQGQAPVFQVQASYFNLRVSKPFDESTSIGDIIATVIPLCSAPTRGSDPTPACLPGCECNPLVLYVTSCPVSTCTEVDARPSRLPNQNQAMVSVLPGAGSTLFLDTGPSGSTAYCNPVLAGEDCMYYFSVSTTQYTDVAATFTIVARMPGDISLVPCSDHSPDGVRMSSTDKIRSSGPGQSGSGQGPGQGRWRYYEVCSQGDGDGDALLVTVEQCRGSTVLYACADDNTCTDVLPSFSSWGYYADSSRVCRHLFPSPSTGNAYGKDVCQPLGPVTRSPELSLPERTGAGNYFVMVNGTGQYILRVQSTRNGIKQSPEIVPAGVFEALPQLTVSAVSHDSVTVQYKQSRVLMPGMSKPSTASFMEYTIYFVEAALVTSTSTLPSEQRPVFSSLCGLQLAQFSYPKSIRAYTFAPDAPDDRQDTATRAFSGLQRGTRYRVTLVATCDSACLRQLSKTLSGAGAEGAGPSVSCMDGAHECKPQSLIYEVLEVETSSHAEPDEDGQHRIDGDVSSSRYALVREVIAFSVVGIVILALLMVTLAAYWKRAGYGYGAHLPPPDGMELVDRSSSSSTSNPVHSNISGNSNRSQAQGYEPPSSPYSIRKNRDFVGLEDEEEEEETLDFGFEQHKGAGNNTKGKEKGKGSSIWSRAGGSGNSNNNNLTVNQKAKGYSKISVDSSGHDEL